MKWIVVTLCLLSIGCTDIIYPPESRQSTSPTSPSPVVVSTRIEFRVTGNADGVRVRYSNALDGLTQVITTLPYIATISTTEQSMFLSLEATPTSFDDDLSFPLMTVQIFADGRLFREASSNDSSRNTLSVSGTWRK